MLCSCLAFVFHEVFQEISPLKVKTLLAEEIYGSTFYFILFYGILPLCLNTLPAQDNFLR